MFRADQRNVKDSIKPAVCMEEAMASLFLTAVAMSIEGNAGARRAGVCWRPHRFLPCSIALALNVWQQPTSRLP
jgi:hypothetical protein